MITLLTRRQLHIWHKPCLNELCQLYFSSWGATKIKQQICAYKSTAIAYKMLSDKAEQNIFLWFPESTIWYRPFLKVKKMMKFKVKERFCDYFRLLCQEEIHKQFFFFYNSRSNDDNSILNMHVKSLHQKSVKKSHGNSLLRKPTSKSWQKSWGCIKENCSSNYKEYLKPNCRVFA